jgi:hypothetical protein
MQKWMFHILTKFCPKYLYGLFLLYFKTYNIYWINYSFLGYLYIYNQVPIGVGRNDRLNANPQYCPWMMAVNRFDVGTVLMLTSTRGPCVSYCMKRFENNALVRLKNNLFSAESPKCYFRNNIFLSDTRIIYL